MGRRKHLTALVPLLVLVACSQGGAPARLSERAEPALVEAWRLTAISPIGQPVRAGDTVVAYGTVNEDLYIYGVSVGDGTIRWRQPASPSRVVSGIPVTPRVLDGRVAYFRPDPAENLAARLVVASPDDGTDVLVSQPFLFRSHPWHCSDGKDICVMTIDGQAQRPRRFSVEAGGLVPDPGAPPTDSRPLGDGLLDLLRRDPEILAGFKDGAIRWQTPLSDHFPAGYGTDWGWHFDLYESEGAHVGSVGRPADHNDASTVVVDLSKHQTVGINVADGSSMWRSEGTSFGCEFAKIDLDRDPTDQRADSWPVRCRYEGIRRYDKATKVTTYERLAVTVEGFDVATGKTTWSRSLGAAEGFMSEEYQAATVSDSEVLVPAATGPIILDLGNGAVRPPAAGEAFWCGEGVLFKFRGNSWRGGTLLARCAADGSPTTATPQRIASSLGATSGDRTVIATTGGLIAYDRAQPGPAR